MKLKPAEAAPRIFEFVFPDAEDAPTEMAEFAVDAAVAGLVVREFLQPKLTSGFRESGVLGTGMPETAIDEKREAHVGKCEIRSAR